MRLSAHPALKAHPVLLRRQEPRAAKDILCALCSCLRRSTASRSKVPTLTIATASALTAALLATTSATARTVDYLDDMAAIQAAADDQGIEGPFAAKPGPGTVRIALETPKAGDHRVTIASVYCQAYGIDNPVSVLLQDLVKAAAPASDAGPALTLRILTSSTVLRCLGKSDVAVTCKNRVRITAEASFTRADGAVAKAPLVAQVERAGRVGGFCGNIARYTGIVTREAGIDLIRQAQAAFGG